jgi:hypothetical protein
MNAQTACTTQSKHGITPRGEAGFGSYPGLLAGVGFIAVLSLAQSDAAWAATAPSLGTENTYAIVSSTFTNGPNVALQTALTGDVCFTTGPSTPPVSSIGTTTTPCPGQTGVDQGAAASVLNGQPCTFLGPAAIDLNALIIGANPPGTIPPGCYSNGGAMNIVTNTTVTLNGAGVYIFRPGGALTTQANSLVVLAGGACANSVFWAPVGATTLGANAAASTTPTFVGNILDAAGITIGNFATLTGRALAFGGTVTTAAVTISVPTCAPFRAGGGADIPTLSEWAMVMLAALLAIAGIVVMRRRTRPFPQTPVH